VTSRCKFLPRVYGVIQCRFFRDIHPALGSVVLLGRETTKIDVGLSPGGKLNTARSLIRHKRSFEHVVPFGRSWAYLFVRVLVQCRGSTRSVVSKCCRVEELTRKSCEPLTRLSTIHVEFLLLMRASSIARGASPIV